MLEGRSQTWVTDVDRASIIAFHETDKSINHVGDIAETAGLCPRFLNRQRLTSKCLSNEVAHHTPVIDVHPRTIRVEDSSNADFYKIPNGPTIRISFEKLMVCED